MVQHPSIETSNRLPEGFRGTTGSLWMHHLCKGIWRLLSKNTIARLLTSTTSNFINQQRTDCSNKNREVLTVLGVWVGLLYNHSSSCCSKQSSFFLEVLLLPSRQGREGNWRHPKGSSEVFHRQVLLEDERAEAKSLLPNIWAGGSGVWHGTYAMTSRGPQLFEGQERCGEETVTCASWGLVPC